MGEGLREQINKVNINHYSGFDLEKVKDMLSRMEDLDKEIKRLNKLHKEESSKTCNKRRLKW